MPMWYGYISFGDAYGINLYASCHAKDLDMPNLSCFLDNLSIVATILCFILSWWAMHWHKAYMSA